MTMERFTLPEHRPDEVIGIINRLRRIPKSKWRSPPPTNALPRRPETLAIPAQRATAGQLLRIRVMLQSIVF
jgi:hypothetical protein